MSIDPKDRKIFIAVVAVMVVIAIIIYTIYQTDSNRMGGMNKIQGYSLHIPVHPINSNV
ncbi:hypothetical protein [Acinetobacter sp. TSRC1-2]|uniref:hypothetical protein n=1 Tax=unclassified Acinetobacter TaxID=196816 RepID=UPI003CE7D93E